MKFEEFKERLPEITHLATGWHGMIYKSEYNNKKVAVKVPKKGLKAHIRKEIDNLESLQSYDFIPSLMLKGEDFFVFEYIPGWHLFEFISRKTEQNQNGQIKEVLFQILGYLFEFDKIGFYKKEMLRPNRNILIDNKGKVFFIDFERSQFNKYYKNIPQFLQFLKNINLVSLKETKSLGKEYKNKPEETYLKIKERIKQYERKKKLCFP